MNTAVSSGFPTLRVAMSDAALLTLQNPAKATSGGLKTASLIHLAETASIPEMGTSSLPLPLEGKTEDSFVPAKNSPSSLLSLSLPTLSRRTIATAALMGAGILAGTFPSLGPALSSVASEALAPGVESVVRNLPYFSGTYAIVLGSIWVHEMGHGIVARQLGYEVEKIHVSWTGIFGYAKFPDEDAKRLWSHNRHNILVGAAGPASSLALGLLLSGVAKALHADEAATSAILPNLLMKAGALNIAVAKFNMYPIPGLDGFRVFLATFKEANTLLRKFFKTS